MIDDFRPQPTSRPKPTPSAQNSAPVVPQLARASIQAKTEDAGTSAENTADKTPGDFRTPEQVAASGEPAATPLVNPKKDAKPKLEQGSAEKWYKFSWPFSRLQWIILSSALVVVLASSAVGYKLTHHAKPVATVKHATKTIKKAPAPVPIYSTLTGLPITDASLNKKPVTGVMIENSIDARPQSGLSQAGVVFEAVAEGGVTRFLALFQDTAPADVGPIRSARPYYVQWAMGFDAAYAHVGGSTDALADITAWGTKDMNQFSNGDYYHRITTRDAPHNVYTSISTLNDLEAKKGFASTFTGFTRKKEAASAAPTATSISMSLSGPTYDPTFVYDTATNSYKRSEAGAPQTDANTNTQVSPKVVIAMVTPLARGELDSSGAYYSNYTVTGSGTAYVFQDGTVTTGQWNKAGTSDPLSFTDSTGKPLPLNPGQTWITAISAVSGVTYK